MIAEAARTIDPVFLRSPPLAAADLEPVQRDALRSPSARPGRHRRLTAVERAVADASLP
jgi:hypothetical protein